MSVVWTDTVTPLNAANMNQLEQIARKGAANGYASLDGTSKVPLAQTPLSPVTNGQWLKGVGGAAVWSAIAAADLPPQAVPGYGTTLPGSPTDGQEYVLVDSLTAPTYVWRFRYNASSASAYKWEFIGGSPFIVLNAGSTPYSAALSTWWNPVSGLQSAPVRAGDWLASITWMYSGPANGPAFYYCCSVGVTAPASYSVASPPATGYTGGMVQARLNSVANASVIQPLWSQSGGTINTVNLVFPLFSLLPIRVS